MPSTLPQPGRTRTRGRRTRGPIAEINVTPFVDVMLVLLIVFMVTAPLLATGVSVDLPEGESSPLPGQDEPLAVTVDLEGAIFIQEDAVTLEALGARLREMTGDDLETRIFVRGDRSIDYGTMMGVVSAINRAGFLRVALLTESAPVGGAPPDDPDRTP